MTNKINNKELEKQLVSKINELYITNRKKYLIMKEITEDIDGIEISNGKYYNFHQEQDKFRPLNDSHIRSHLRGKETLGVFSGQSISKFLCFDLDIKDKTKLRWAYYLLVDTLNELGIHNEHIHVATSGNKGIHINIFIENGANLKSLISLFNITMNKIKEYLSDNIYFKTHSSDGHFGEFDFGQIEMRPTHTQGVKIELGRNFFNPNSLTNKCVFLDNETLEPLDNSYLLHIEPMKKDQFNDIMDRISDKEIIHEEVIEKEVDEIKTNLKESSSMKINKDEPETIESIKYLLINGLFIEGTRHNSTLKIAKYFRYMGLELNECIDELKTWMQNQNKKYYSSTLEFALSECERIGNIVYEKEYSLFGNVENIKIYKSEIEQILQVNSKNDKLLLYSMLIHSKRYALKNRVFYMTFSQMKEMFGISRNGAMTAIERLEEAGLIEVVSRNVRQENGYKHKPNKYKLLLDVVENEDVVALEIDNSSNTLDCNDLYNRSVVNCYSNKELKEILPTRQLLEISKFRNSLAS